MARDVGRQCLPTVTYKQYDAIINKTEACKYKPCHTNRRSPLPLQCHRWQDLIVKHVSSLQAALQLLTAAAIHHFLSNQKSIQYLYLHSKHCAVLQMLAHSLRLIQDHNAL